MGLKKEQFGRIGDAWAGCPAVRSGDFIFYSGQMAPDVASGDVGYSVSYRSKEQTAEVFRFFESLAKEAGSSIDDVVKLQTFHVDLDDFPPQVEARRNAFTPPLPPSTAIECALPHPAADAMGPKVVRRLPGYIAPGKQDPLLEALAQGVSPPRVYAEVYERHTPAFVRLSGVALSGSVVLSRYRPSVYAPKTPLLIQRRRSPSRRASR